MSLSGDPPIHSGMIPRIVFRAFVAFFGSFSNPITDFPSTEIILECRTTIPKRPGSSSSQSKPQSIHSDTDPSMFSTVSSRSAMDRICAASRVPVLEASSSSQLTASCLPRTSSRRRIDDSMRVVIHSASPRWLALKAANVFCRRRRGDSPASFIVKGSLRRKYASSASRAPAPLNAIKNGLQRVFNLQALVAVREN